MNNKHLFKKAWLIIIGMMLAGSVFAQSPRYNPNDDSDTTGDSDCDPCAVLKALIEAALEAQEKQKKSKREMNQYFWLTALSD